MPRTPVVEATFNRVSVDGDCSTNDAVVLLANGQSGCARNDASFAAAVREMYDYLDNYAAAVTPGVGFTDDVRAMLSLELSRTLVRV